MTLSERGNLTFFDDVFSPEVLNLAGLAVLEQLLETRKKTLRSFFAEKPMN